MNLGSSVVILLATLLISADNADAWLRISFPDSEVVSRSELIVVGHLKEKSVQYVPHKEPGSFEHHATLVVTEILKGKAESNEIPVIIHYGLLPATVVGGYVNEHGYFMDLRGSGRNYSENSLPIFDTGSSIHSLKPLIEDAAKDNLWCLRRRSGIYGREPGAGDLGIVDPEDIEPAELRDYFKMYMSEDPERAVRSYIAIHPETAERAKRYLNHLEIQRILEISDPGVRFERLLPYYLEKQFWDHHFEAREAIVSCGKPAGDKLTLLFDDPKFRKFRADIISIWRDMKYEEAVPILIRLLEEHNRFWAAQVLTKGWWNQDVGSELTEMRRDVQGEDFDSVYALHSFKGPRVKEVIELTKWRWELIGPANSQILEECTAALKDLESD